MIWISEAHLHDMQKLCAFCFDPFRQHLAHQLVRCPLSLIMSMKRVTCPMFHQLGLTTVLKAPTLEKHGKNTAQKRFLNDPGVIFFSYYVQVKCLGAVCLVDVIWSDNNSTCVISCWSNSEKNGLSTSLFKYNRNARGYRMSTLTTIWLRN